MRTDPAIKGAMIPVAAGIFFTFLMLQVGSRPMSDSVHALWLSEAGFFLVAALIGCASHSKRPFAAACLVLSGVSLGVLLDVVVHPDTAEGYERNLFPIEIIAHVLLAMPVVFAVAIIFQIVAFARSTIKHDR